MEYLNTSEASSKPDIYRTKRPTSNHLIKNLETQTGG